MNKPRKKKTDDGLTPVQRAARKEMLAGLDHYQPRGISTKWVKTQRHKGELNAQATRTLLAK